MRVWKHVKSLPLVLAFTSLAAVVGCTTNRPTGDIGYADAAAAQPDERDSFVNAAGITMIAVRRSTVDPETRAAMGVPEAGEDVLYYIAATETTESQYNGGADGGGEQSRFPVVNVTWQQAMDFCDTLPALPGWRYALPTEAQWDLACRLGRGSGSLASMTWYGSNSGLRVHEVATRKASAIGLYDMHGNVREWCRDYFRFRQPIRFDRELPTNGFDRVRRGGAFDTPIGWCECGYQDGGIPNLPTEWTGFRVVMERVSEGAKDVKADPRP